VSQTEFGGQAPPSRQAGRQVPVSYMHRSSPGQASSLSHIPGSIGRQAPTQSSHPGQLEVAQPSQIAPGPQPSQKPPPHAGAHSPVSKMQTLSPGQWSCVVQETPPVEVLEVVLEVLLVLDVALVLDVVLPAPPSPLGPSTTAVPPQAKRATNRRIERRIGTVYRSS